MSSNFLVHRATGTATTGTGATAVALTLGKAIRTLVVHTDGVDDLLWKASYGAYVPADVSGASDMAAVLMPADAAGGEAWSFNMVGGFAVATFKLWAPSSVNYDVQAFAQ